MQRSLGLSDEIAKQDRKSVSQATLNLQHPNSCVIRPSLYVILFDRDTATQGDGEETEANIIKNK